uniref:Uncharacterized protein n=1 Tax=Arundo donax TaxID=35708 RepID=A0A0A9BA93_ARUDO
MSAKSQELVDIPFHPRRQNNLPTKSIPAL